MRRKGGPRYLLRLYVSGSGPLSLRALDNLKRFCQKFLPGRYELETIDIDRHPLAAFESQIVAVPTLEKRWPLPEVRVVGNLSRTDKLLEALGVGPEEAGRAAPGATETGSADGRQK